MARKFYYYVGVQTNDGMRFVTKINNSNRMSYWNLNEKPLEMTQMLATDIAEGLCMNCTTAVVVKSFFELADHFVVRTEPTVKEVVEDAVKKLGYSGKVEIATVSVGRVIVWVDDERIGIYDLNRNTFVD